MNNLPPGWASGTVGSILHIQYGQALPERSRDATGQIPVYGSAGRVGYHSSSIVDGPAIVIGRKGSVGATYLEPGACWPIDTTYFSRLPDGLCPAFVAYQLQSMPLKNLDSSTAVPSLRREDLEAQPLAIAPTAEQERIVAAIEEQFSRLDAGVAALGQACRNLKSMRAAVLQAAVAGNLVPDSGQPWSKRLLPTLGTVDRGRSRHRPRNAPELYGGPYPFIQTGDVASATPWIKSYSQTYNETGLAQSKLWPSGTLCITIAANIARTGILTFDACFPDSVVGFVAEDGPIATRWVELILRQMQGKLEQLAPATAQKNINLAVLKALEIPYPELPYLALVIEEYDRQMSLIASLEESLDAASRQSDRLRSSILATAFSGKITVQDPGEEPASVFLERIAVKHRPASNGKKTRRGRKPLALQEEATA